MGDNSLERVESTKLLGVIIHCNLKWDDHIKHLAASCYGTLATLKKKIKNFTNYKLRKHLAESLVLSPLDFSDIVFYPLSENNIGQCDFCEKTIRRNQKSIQYVLILSDSFFGKPSRSSETINLKSNRDL